MGKAKGDCCNPFKHGSHKKFSLVYNITAGLVKKAKSLNKRINKTEMICNACRIEIKNKFKRTSSAEVGAVGEPVQSNTMQPIDMDDEPMEMANEDENSSESEAEIEMDHVSTLEVKQCSSNLLLALGLKPIDNVKIRAKKIKKKFFPK